MITVNIDKAKALLTTQRRAVRQEEFAPLDAIIASQIPGTDIQEIEAQRQAIREKHAALQLQIAAAVTEEKLLDIHRQLVG